MSGTKQLQEAASILQEADVSNIVSAMALGIAEAQKQLDDNSVKQTLLLADPSKGINGKSLLELGFTPAFYHFQYADISASISLKMKLNTDFELKLSASVDYDRQGGISQENLDYMKETESAEHRDEFKSSRQFIHSASESESVKVNKQSVKMDQTEGAVTKVQKFAQDMRQVTNVDRVRTDIKQHELGVNKGSSSGVVISNGSGYLMITLPREEAVAWGIYQINAYDSTSAVDLDTADSHSFTVGADYDTTFGDAETAQGAGTIIGFSEAGYRLKGTSTDVGFEHRFALDHSNIDFGYNTNPASATPFDVLADILKRDSSARIKIVGHTDGSGPDKYNEYLSGLRAQAMEDWFVAKGAQKSQIDKEYVGERDAPDENPNVAFRRVTVELLTARDYLYFSDANFDDGAESAGGDTENKWLAVEAASSGASKNVKVELGGQTRTITATDYASLSAAILAKSYFQENYSQETVNNVHHLLHNESTLKHIAYSKNEDEIEIVNSQQEASETNTNETTYRLDATENNKTKILKEADKIENPSTLAIGGSVDFRTSRQFEVSAEGNSSVSARLVSLPAPPEFLDEIKAYLS